MTLTEKAVKYLKTHDISNKSKAEVAQQLGVSRRTLDRALELAKSQTTTTTKPKKVKDDAKEVQPERTDMSPTLSKRLQSLPVEYEDGSVREKTRISILKNLGSKLRNQIIQMEAFYACPIHFTAETTATSLVEYLQFRFEDATREQIIEALGKALTKGIVLMNDEKQFCRGFATAKVITYYRKYKEILTRMQH